MEQILQNHKQEINWLLNKINLKIEETSNFNCDEGINQTEEQLEGEINYLIGKSRLQERDLNKLNI